MKIVMLDRTGTDVSLEKKAFRKIGATFLVTYFQDADEVLSIAKDADVLLLRDAPLEPGVIAKLEKCKLIVCYGNFRDIDLQAAEEKGILVCAVPAYDAWDIAEHTMALLLSAAKHIPMADICAKNGKWNGDGMEKSRRLRGKALGLVGFDPVARLVAARARAFEMELLVSDPYANLAAIHAIGAENISISALLTDADYVSLHLPYSEETLCILGMPQFRQMKKDAVLINTSHSALVNESELIYALLTGEIGGAALDVCDEEPLSQSSKLLSMSNVIITPRVAGNSFEGAAALSEAAVETVLRFIQGESPQNIVNGVYLSGQNR